MLKRYVVLVLVLASLGCRHGKRPRPDRVTDSAENQATLARIHAYVACLDYSARVFEIADRYRERFSAAPPSAEATTMVQPSPDPKRCLDGLHDIDHEVPPIPDLDAAGKRYTTAFATLFELTTTAYEAFDRTSTKYAPSTGVVLHAKLLAAFEDFDTAQGALFDQVYRLNRTVHIDQLAQREEKYGRSLIVIAEDMMLRAEDLVQFAGVRWDHLEAIDLDTMSVRLAQFEQVVVEMETYRLANPHESDALMKGFPILAHRADDYVIAVKQLVARARSNISFSDSERIMISANNERQVVGTPRAMIDAYNRLVDAYYPLTSR